MAPPKHPTHVVSIRLPQDVYDAWKAIADTAGVSVSTHLAAKLTTPIRSAAPNPPKRTPEALSGRSTGLSPAPTRPNPVQEDGEDVENRPF